MEADAVTHSQPLDWALGTQFKGQEGWYLTMEGRQEHDGENHRERYFNFFVCDSG